MATVPTRSGSPRQLTTKQTGDAWEAQARRWLEGKGLRFIAANVNERHFRPELKEVFRTSGGEFDNGVSLLIHIHRVFFEGSVEYQPASSAVRNAVSTSVIREVREYRIISDLQ